MDPTVRELILAHAGLPAGAGEVSAETDLYRAGMKSFASVQLMLALEEAFDIEFPDELLTRATFRSPGSIEAAVTSLTSAKIAA